MAPTQIFYNGNPSFTIFTKIRSGGTGNVTPHKLETVQRRRVAHATALHIQLVVSHGGGARPDVSTSAHARVRTGSTPCALILPHTAPACSRSRHCGRVRVFVRFAANQKYPYFVRRKAPPDLHSTSREWVRRLNSENRPERELSAAASVGGRYRRVRYLAITAPPALTRNELLHTDRSRRSVCDFRFRFRSRVRSRLDSRFRSRSCTESRFQFRPLFNSDEIIPVEHTLLP
ncbi:hypothetical protein EVAR_35199_1 [Eumeta japonica]|uniref:Uncharacterized protein n=1 Tax=Eumeta variegata TaxID=151549 RepID=A0A4C1VCV6_EUMVA|nr:hypothetical protein EVAR_35199_1 [Eumeta japonica]